MSEQTTTAAELFVQCLETEGVEYIFGVPGEENLAFLEALRTSSITFITTRHEQGAVFMAATTGRFTGKVGVALSTLGPGATNLVTGVAYAQLGGMPLLVITGQKPIRHSKQGKFQIIDVVGMMKPLTKYAATILSGERIPSMVREAIKIAESERPGAVHLEFPEDIAEEIVTARPIEPQKVRRPASDAKAITEAIAAIEKAHHPIVVIASGANRKLIRKQLKAFVEKTGIPFVTTQMGKGVEDERSEFYIGTTALSSGDYMHEALKAADCIIVLGHDISEKPPIVLTPAEHTVIHINFSPANVDEVYIPTHEIVGDVSHALWSIIERITPQKHWNFTYFFKARTALLASIAEHEGIADFPIMPERFVRDLRRTMPEDSILSLDNGLYKIWIARNYPAYEQNSVLLDNALATMGAGLSAGIAAKMLHPEQKVAVVAGDGGIMMNIAELETAVRLGVDLVVIVLCDGEYGMIRWKQRDMEFKDFGLKFGNPDFVKLAESFGAVGHRVTKTEEFASKLKDALDGKGVHIIECPINYAHTNAALGENLRAAIERI
jgi:acetolactate synthase-1/2/3 large subunit